MTEKWRFVTTLTEVYTGLRLLRVVTTLTLTQTHVQNFAVTSSISYSYAIAGCCIILHPNSSKGEIQMLRQQIQ